jgi:hypothetical protein
MDPENKIPAASDETRKRPQSACESMPDFTRLRYFHGQMLGHHDFQNEQDYFREKLKLLNRCLHGYGTVCGLKVVAHKFETGYGPGPDAAGAGYGDKYAESGAAEKLDSKSPDQRDPADPYTSSAWDRRRLHVEVECGLAVDCEGNELIVRQPLRVDLWQELSDAERRELETGAARRHVLYLSICYCVQPIDPVRPVLPDACSAVSECVYSKLRESVRVKVSTQKPTSNHCRDNCCDKCDDKCLLLAAIDLTRDQPPVIRNDVRRWLTTYEPVTITGINWVHGADGYTPEEAASIIQEQGLTIEFSRAILPETVTRGVVEVWVFEGGKGRHSGMYYIDGEISAPDNYHLVFRDTSDEMLEHGDRVLVVVRTDFILDECCRAIDGNHTGGRVPLLEKFAGNKPRYVTSEPARACARPPRRYGDWTSGNGTPGGTFESWFYIRRPPKAPRPYQEGQERPQQAE